jgi:hypothetical protein
MKTRSEAAAPAIQFLYSKMHPGGVWLAQKRQTIGSAVKLYSATNRTLSNNYFIIFIPTYHLSFLR